MPYVNFFVKPGNPSAVLRDRVSCLFQDHGYEVSYIFRQDADFNVVIGGDGTFFRAVHTSHFSPIPFLGINTGSLGYFQEIDSQHIDSYMDRLFQGDYQVQSLGLLAARAETSSWTYDYQAINEFTITTSDQKILRTHLAFNEIPLIQQAGDGLIFSTPAGSTAYNLSAGGSILYQTLDGYQVQSLAPIRSKTFNSLPASIVVPSSTVSTVTFPAADAERAVLVIDGIRDTFVGLRKIQIWAPDQSIQRIVFNPHWYWYNLQDKLI